ncbi:MAG TPA: alpha/beta-hydrolase family protein [Ornithinibacter sp.]|nr:alpha/beta-hydrolase family protein [Ornithinibacter sp.]
MTTTGAVGPLPSDIGVQVGLVVAAAEVPGSFGPGLAPRSAVDQGLVTGLSTGVHYLLALGTQDALQAVAAGLARAPGAARWGDLATRQRTLALALDVAAVPVGLALRRLLPSHPGEAMARGWVRQAGWRAGTTGVAALSLEAARVGLRALDERMGAGGRVAGLPVAVPLGLTIAFVVDRRRGMPGADDVADLSATPPLARSALVAAGVEGGLVAVAYAEHALASAAGGRLAEVLPGGPHLWRLVTHAATLGLVAVTATNVWERAMRGIEAGASADEPVFGGDEGARWTGPTLSGGPGSLVPWATLGKEGRRHMLTHVRPTPAQERPPGFADLPDLSIETVMGEPALAAPVQVYVGLDSAPTVRERVDLALAEMERTGAFDRSLLVLVSPTGLGYVNYVALAAAQYLSRGDIASVTMQYSRRPSPLSLGRVGQAREQNRLLWLRVIERIRQMEGRRPRVVLFGESLGAHTSQDVFLHWGTLGLRALGIDRALWIGTPYGSEWMHEVTGPDRLDVDRDSVAVVNDLAQLGAVTQARGSLPPYVLLSHDNDGVTRFGPDLLTTEPAWLGPHRPRTEHVDGASPRGIPGRLRWRPVTTFFQTLVDVKNAQVPGTYQAWGHDYRPDLPGFVSEVYGLPASAEQLARVTEAVRRREEARWEVFQED